MLSSMSQDDRKVMLHLLTSDAEQDATHAEKSSSGSTGDHEYSQWTVASPRLSSLSILLPAMPDLEEDEGEGTGAAEVVELSCGLARTWRISAD